MDNKEQAQIVHKAFKLLFRETTDKARNGSKKAALDVMSEMTALHLVLKSLGFMTNDEGKLVKYKQRVLSEYETLVLNSSKSEEDAQKLFDYLIHQEHLRQ